MAYFSNTGLVLVDVQKGFDHPSHWGNKRSNPQFETNLQSLLACFRRAKQASQTGSSPLIVHVFHSSTSPNSPLHKTSPGIEFQPYAEPRAGELVLSKSVNSSFIGTDLESILRQHDIHRLFVAGLTTDHCVSTTTRMAANLGVTDYLDAATGEVVKGQVVLVEDATATWERGNFDAETVHQVQVESLKGEFCDVMSTAEIVKEMSSKAGVQVYV